MAFHRSVFAAAVLLSLSGAARAADPAPASLKAEPYLLLPEPRFMHSSLSKTLGNAAFTVFTPAQEPADHHAVQTYTAKEFARLGIGWDSFKEKCVARANERLATLQPDLVRDPDGKIIYAVYRGSDPSTGCLIVGTSLSKIFEKLFGDTLWLITPDRNSLFVFPPKSDALPVFAADLKDRFDNNPLSNSEEIFQLKRDGALRVVGNFTGHQMPAKGE